MIMNALWSCLAPLLLAAERRAPRIRGLSHALMGVSLSRHGDLREAWKHVGAGPGVLPEPATRLTAEEMRALYPPTQVTAAFVLLSGGYLDQARQQIEQILTLEWAHSPDRRQA